MIVQYDESILSYISSIRAFYGLESTHAPNKKLSALLKEKDPKKIFLILVDGMGANLIKRKLPADAFLNQYTKYTTSTVYPSTTTAATTSIKNGKEPIENGWLGWSQYLNEVDDIIVPFLSNAFYSDKKYEPNIFEKYVPVTSTEKELCEIGINARIINPSFDPDGCDTIEEMCDRLNKYSHSNEYKYIYAYWDQYDSLMHKHGPKSEICDKYLKKVNDCLEELSRSIADDTMLIIVADHGQIDVEKEYDLYGSKYDKYFTRRPSIEFRAMSICVKKELKEEFEKEFKNEFENDYILLNYDQVLKMNIFGTKQAHPRLKEFVGDYLAIAKGKMSFRYKEYDKTSFAGEHAGMHEDEMMIPVIVYMK